MEGKNPVVRNSSKTRNMFLKGLSLPLLSFGTLLCPEEILLYDAKDYIRNSSDAYLIVSSGMLFEIWRVCFFPA